MRHIVFLLSSIFLWIFANCNSGYRAPYGFFLQQSVFNRDFISQGNLGKKVGEGCIVSYLLLISQGDASVKAAAHNAPDGGITKIYAIDYRKEQFLGIIQQKLCTIVYGD